MVESRDDVMLDEDISTINRISSDVGEGPETNIDEFFVFRRVDEVNEEGDSTTVDDDLGLFSGATADVGEHPSGFELEFAVGTLEETNDDRNEIELDDL